MYQLGLVLLGDAEDDNEEDFAMEILLLGVREERNFQSSGKYGRRGVYDACRSVDFFDNFIFRTSERVFKSHFQ